jgi:hypothetical protein
MIREQFESMDDITAIDDEVRGIVERNWPQLVSKLRTNNAEIHRFSSGAVERNRSSARSARRS